jgi:hypothetical protein
MGAFFSPFDHQIPSDSDFHLRLSHLNGEARLVDFS